MFSYVLYNVLLDLGRTYLQSTSLFVDCLPSQIGDTPLPRKLKWLAFGPRGVGALPVHAITIASDAHGFKKDDIVPMINRCSIRGALFFTYFFVS